MDDYDTAEEFLLMAQSGMGFQQILASLTTAPAERFGISARVGKLAPGMDADIVLLSGDPSIDVRAFSKVRYTIRRGRIIYRLTRAFIQSVRRERNPAYEK
jgi:imidazolonepropionase-like amidohydrolase